MKKKNLMGAISVIMSALLFVNCFGIFSVPENQNDSEKLTRTIPLDETKLTYFDSFETYSISDEDDVPVFRGSSVFYEEDASFFNNVALEDDPDEYSTSFFCTFDMEELVYHVEISLIDKNGQEIGTETFDTQAFVNEKGMLDALVEIGDETFLVSEIAYDLVNNCGIATWLLGNLAATVSPGIAYIYFGVTQVAEQIRSRQNYKYNKQLESSGEGVSLGNYIFAQEDSRSDEYKSANYHFGFTSFADVGCEVASAYNALIAMGIPELLSETIFTFEKLAIEYAAGWGYLGSDAEDMTRFFNTRNISYKMYYSFSRLEAAIANYDHCYIIMSRWNTPRTAGIHTFFIEKDASRWEPDFHGYNVDSRHLYDTTNNNNLVSYNNGGGFIVGFIVSRHSGGGRDM